MKLEKQNPFYSGDTPTIQEAGNTMKKFLKQLEEVRIYIKHISKKGGPSRNETLNSERARDDEYLAV